ncbi:MAG TPA: DNA recombination protein RmuC [Candidatus Angelobacter sp.]|nr:DNA recombination protein RmuC [Candidatus Angelobacter sp.]
MVFSSIAFIIFGAVIGCLVSWLLARSRSQVLDVRLATVQNDLNLARAETQKLAALNAELNTRRATLETTLEYVRKANDEKIELLDRATTDLREAFQALSADALKSNNQAFLELARTSLERFQSEAKGDLKLRQEAVANLVAPIGESLRKVESQIQQIERDRSEAYGDLTAQVRSLIGTQEKLQAETGNLVKALRTPTVRGRWGEIQLRRVVEIAGMLSYCDFSEQETISTSNGRLRPDLVIKLPGGKNVVVDAKTPLLAYLDAIDSTDDALRLAKLRQHAQQVRTHLTQLSSKGYWEQFEASPEFVVMFLPGETFFSAALEQDPTLIEYGVTQRVIPASPTTLIALLKAIAFGWNQEKLARNAKEISSLGKELHDRLRTLGTHFEQVGRGLDKAVESYNKAVGSLETRVMVSARKFAELGAPVTDELPPISVIDTTTRNLTLEFDEEEDANALPPAKP